MRFSRLAYAAFALSFLALAARGQTSEWIWSSKTPADNGDETVYFRKTFRTPPLLWNARLTVSADDNAEIFLNGVSVARCERWDQPIKAEVSVRLNQGENVIAARAVNRSGGAGLLVHLNLLGRTNLVSDSSWLVSTKEEERWASLNFNAAHWKNAESVGLHGIAPWGEILFRSSATPAEAIKTLSGFKVELLRSATPDEGSWVCLAFDNKGRAIVSPEGDRRPLVRFTFEDGKIAKAEPVPAPIHFAMGLLYAFDSLYANAIGPSGAGLYRLIDKNGNDQFDPDEVQLLKKFEGGSEHGYHALALGPDKKIYVLNGNGTKLPGGLSANSPYRNYAEDSLSLNLDDEGQDGTKAPNCYVLRTDSEGNEWELFSAGMRNAYGFDFNADGELFAFDSDMEWDWGTAWYRATRIVHCVSGGENGWRDGFRMWGDYYLDSLPAVVEIGIGSPTGVQFGTRSNFSEKYRKALFAADWSYGRILAVHLSPDGAGYRGTFEPFVEGKPLNLTSIAFGPDRAMYFTTGGRATQSGLYRVSYTGAVPAGSESIVGASAKREERRRLEAFHTRVDENAVNQIWPQLGSVDRHLRFAARVALEAQPAESWKARALNEKEEAKAFAALLALTRVGTRADQAEVLRSLGKFPLGRLDTERQLEKLRIIQVSLLRHGKPTGPELNHLMQELTGIYPSGAASVNHELTRILLFLEAPGAVHTAISLLQKAKTQEEQFFYVAQLKNAKNGWSIDDRRAYFAWWRNAREPKEHSPEILKWFADVGREYVDGAYMDRYLREFRGEALAALTAEERHQLGALIKEPVRQAQSLPSAGRAFVQEWKLEDILPELEKISTRRNFARGQQAMVDAQCIACHRFGNDGGVTGPELSGAGSKYSPRDLLEAILAPSKVINEQYQNTTVTLKDGDSVTGRVVSKGDAEVVIETDALSGAKEKIPAEKVAEIKPAALSPMPEGLVNILSKEEILDLVAYIANGGNSGAAAFQN